MHAPFELLCQEAEKKGVKMPTKKTMLTSVHGMKKIRCTHCTVTCQIAILLKSKILSW